MQINAKMERELPRMKSKMLIAGGVNGLIVWQVKVQQHIQVAEGDSSWNAALDRQDPPALKQK